MLDKKAISWNFVRLVVFVGMAVIILRVTPHIADCIPIFALLTILNNTNKVTKKSLMIFALIAILISDCLLNIIYHYPVFGNYTLFTYSGFALVIYMQFRLPNKRLNLFINSINATLLYWVWTNFGVWLLAEIYPLTTQGFVVCYTLAWPFLMYSILANGLGVLLFMLLQYILFLRSLNTSKSNCIYNIIH